MRYLAAVALVLMQCIAIAQCGPNGCPPSRYYSSPFSQCGPQGCPPQGCPGGICPPQQRQAPRAGVQESIGGSPFTRPYSLTGNVEDAAVRVTNSAFTGAGSGTCIDYDAASGDMLVLSACHIFYDSNPRDPIDARGPAEVIMFDGTKLRGPMLGMYTIRGGDCALLRVHTGKPYPYVPLRESPPEVGSTVYKVGFPAWKKGLRDVGTGTVAEVANGELFTRMKIESGDSGGGVFSADSFLVGVVSRHEMEVGPNGQPTGRSTLNSTCCCLGPIRALIGKVGWKSSGSNGQIRQGGILNNSQIVQQVQPQQSGGVQGPPLKPATPPVQPAAPIASVPTPTPAAADLSKSLASITSQLDALSKSVDELAKQKNLPGPKGDKGDPGAAGVAGKAGADGKPGADGKNGIDGKPGPVGSVGQTGPQGVAGASGKDADPSAIAAAVQSALAAQPPMTCILKDVNGNTINTATFGPNQPLILRLVPVTTPTPPATK